MKNVVLVTGMRGSGKTTYCNLVKERHPEVHVISRDEFFVANFGDCTFDIYSGLSKWASELFWGHVREVLSQYSGLFVIDAWTGRVSVREAAIKRLREYGATAIDCWFIDAEKDVCARQFAERELPKSKYSTLESLVRRSNHDWGVFHENLSDIFPTEEDMERRATRDWLYDKTTPTFDKICVIHPDQGIFPGMPLV